MPWTVAVVVRALFDLSSENHQAALTTTPSLPEE
jgi:hypothetical protein